MNKKRAKSTTGAMCSTLGITNATINPAGLSEENPDIFLTFSLGSHFP